jgi:large repetitive protein
MDKWPAYGLNPAVFTRFIYHEFRLMQHSISPRLCSRFQRLARSFRAFLAGVALLSVLTSAAQAGIAMLGTQSSQYGSSKTLSNFTVPSGTNRLLVVTAGDPNTPTNPSGVTFNGSAMSQANATSDGGYSCDSIFYLKLGTGAATTGDVVVSFAGTGNYFVSAVVFSGVDQTTPVDTNGPKISGSVTTSGDSLVVSSQAGSLVFDHCDTYFDTAQATESPGASQTKISDAGGVIVGGGYGRYLTSTQAGASPNVTMSWTGNAGAILHLTMNIHAAVVAPSVTSITPTSGPAAGGTTVTITGSSFTGVTGVKFGATAATSFTFVSDTQITATSPAGTGTVDVTVTNTIGTSSTSASDQFTYVAAPTVTSISPTSGPTAGGTTVTITGTNFTGATAVTFGATAATSFTVNSATSITATSPAGTGTVDMRVTTAGGTSAISAADQFTYVAAPRVTSISPTSGPTAGGTTVTITGTNFTGATAVIFGATAATSFTVNSATQITATSPAGTGTVDVRVTTAGGTSATSAADQFTYMAAPTVTSISPSSGPTAGGTTVTITGTNFTGATAVIFGSTAATGFTVNSATQITATSPAGLATVDVRVTTAGGTSAASAADQFTYVAAPTVSSISPTSGPTAGGTSVVITGTNFTGATAVTFGATVATGFTVNSATQITATSPAGVGTVDVRVTTAGGASATSAADQFTYVAAPTITSISPTAGPTAGGTTVTITGTNFTGASAVTFGATAATSFTVNSATQITAASPAGTGTVDVRVTTAGGTSATSAADQFKYVAAPTVTSISPTSGPAAGGTTVTITGTNFTGATAVTFGAMTATGFTVNSATQITATSPAGLATVDVSVTTAGGTSATSAADQFTYVAAPTVTGISPTSGPALGSTTVTITGTNFTGATAVTFGGTAATGFTVVSATSITATSPAGTGTVDVRVTTVGGTSATSAADQFTYLATVVTKFLVTVSPSTTTAGTAVSFTVTPQDVSGNTATDYVGTVHFTKSDSGTGSVVPSDYTFVTGDHGVHTFTSGVTFVTSGAQTVTATDTVSSANGTSGNVTVNAGAATYLAVSAPANGAAGVPFNFSVTALDAYNNTATGYTGTVHFTGGDPAATLPADYSFVGGDAGIHVFTNGASLPTAGLRTLTAADTVTPSIKGASSVITVSATITGASRSATFLDTTQADFQGGVATSLDLTGSPGDAVLGAAGPNQSNATVGTSGVGITTTTWGGQTFTPSVSGQLTKASLHLFASGATGTTPNLTLSLRATSGGLPIGADLASTTITGFNNGADAKYTATFSSPATVTAGTQYALIIRPTANPSPGTYALTRSGTSTAGSDVYSGGTRVSGATSGTVWSIPLTGGVSTDAGFEIFIGSSGASNADLISSVKDSTPGTLTTAWQSLSWTSSVAAGGVLQFQVAGSSSSSGPFAFIGPDGTAATYYTTSGASLSQFNGSRYLKYRAYFTGTSNGAVTMSDVTLVASVLPTVTQTTTSQTAAASTVVITGTGFDTTPLNNQVTLNNGASGTVTSATSTQLTVTLSTRPNALGALTAVVTSDSISSGTPVQVATIIPGPADHLAFGVSPSSTVAGVVISPAVTVQVLDASGLLTTSTANVTLGIGTNPGSAVLNGTTTVAAISGVATFSNLSINTSATGYKLSASSGAMTGAASGAFNIMPAAVSSLAVSAPVSSTAGSSFNITVTAQDAFLNTVPGYTGTVHFSTSDSAGLVSLPSNYTFTPGDSGAHTFTGGVKLVTAGNQIVTATDTVTSSITGTSGSIAVSAAAASHLVVSSAGTATAGVAINSSVTALDAFGNTATTYTGTVHFTSSDAGASVVLPANYTFLPADNGAHVFTGALTFVTAGNQTLTATDTISGSITGTSNVTTVSAAAAAHLVVSAPGTATAGVAINTTVTAQDQYGNTATSYLGTVNFTKTDAGSSAAVPANYSFVAGDNGSHTFTSGVTLVTAGIQTVTATDTVTGTITGTSGSITVNPAATSHFVFTGPSSASPGIAVTITVTAEDAFNNVTPAYTGTLAFTLTDSGTGAAVPANYTFVSGDAGIHTFTNGVTFATPGQQTLTATDTVSSSVKGSAIFNVGTLNPTATQLVPTNPVTGLPLPPGSLYPVISQSGTIEVRVSIKNTTALPINGFRLSVDYSAYLPFHSLVLYNRTSPSNYSEPAQIDYIDYPYPVAVGATVSLKLQFYTTTRTLPNPFNPTLTVTTLAASELSSTDGSGVQPRITMLPTNNILLEWDSTVGQWYRVKYSSDLVNWFDCPVPVQGVANRTQWVDDGPPFTNAPPSSVGSRYYKLNAISAPTGP